MIGSGKDGRITKADAMSAVIEQTESSIMINSVESNENRDKECV